MAVTIKQILTSNQNWWRFYEKHKGTLRTAITKAITKLLSCRDKIRGYLEYKCQNPNCFHVKRLNFTCKSKACSSCGKKATELWIQKQYQKLPRTTWQHITFTMPSELWDFFWCNRPLLNLIPKLAADCLKTIAAKHGVTPGIFIAIHTFGRNLKRNVHVHVSVTVGGLSEDFQHWKKVFFDQATLMRMWRYKIITLFRKTNSKQPLIIPGTVKRQLTPVFTFSHLLDALYKKPWIVHCAKPSNDHKINVNYLGRYTKRPPIAESKLRHYDGNEVTFSYLDHTTKTRKKLTLSSEEFIARFVQHIPDEGFRMIRYYGFLAHRVIGKLLPIAYQLLGQKIENQSSPSYAMLIEKSFGFNPLICILCGQPLVLTSICFGISNIYQLLTFHRQLALLQKTGF